MKFMEVGSHYNLKALVSHRKTLQVKSQLSTFCSIAISLVNVGKIPTRLKRVTSFHIFQNGWFWNTGQQSRQQPTTHLFDNSFQSHAPKEYHFVWKGEAKIMKHLFISIALKKNEHYVIFYIISIANFYVYVPDRVGTMRNFNSKLWNFKHKTFSDQ